MATLTFPKQFPPELFATTFSDAFQSAFQTAFYETCEKLIGNVPMFAEPLSLEDLARRERRRERFGSGCSSWKDRPLYASRTKGDEDTVDTDADLDDEMPPLITMEEAESYSLLDAELDEMQHARYRLRGGQCPCSQCKKAVLP